MTTTVWGFETDVTVAGASETVIAAVNVTGLDIASRVLLVPSFVCTSIDGSVSVAHLRVLRTSFPGEPVPGIIDAVVLASTLLVPFGVTPIFEDGPGQPSEQTYLLTVRLEGAMGASTGIRAGLIATYN